MEESLGSVLEEEYVKPDSKSGKSSISKPLDSVSRNQEEELDIFNYQNDFNFDDEDQFKLEKDQKVSRLKKTKDFISEE